MNGRMNKDRRSFLCLLAAAPAAAPIAAAAAMRPSLALRDPGPMLGIPSKDVAYLDIKISAPRFTRENVEALIKNLGAAPFRKELHFD